MKSHESIEIQKKLYLEISIIEQTIEDFEAQKAELFVKVVVAANLPTNKILWFETSFFTFTRSSFFKSINGVVISKSVPFEIIPDDGVITGSSIGFTPWVVKTK